MPHQDRPAPQPKFWQYEIAPGWTVFAGKTDEDNDLISTVFAKPDDYWFHSHSVPGSHVLLRGLEDAGEPDRKILEAAAAVAAWHSKARNAGNCQVDCTRARYVSKPPRVPAGTVNITNFKILKVRPGLPAAN